METRASILNIADQLIRNKGFNAFSFSDISKSIGIKTASIHYHFPTKTDLGLATIKKHAEKFTRFKKGLEGKSPVVKIENFLSMYSKIKSENKVCLVGSLATDLNTVDKKIKMELRSLAGMILDWVTETLHEGKSMGIFHFRIAPRTKALMVITNMLASVQLSRLTNENDFKTIRRTVLKEIRS